MSFTTFLQGRSYTQLRGLAWMALAETGHVVTETIIDDSGGGGSSSWIAGTAVPCRIDDLAGSEGVTGGKLSNRSTHLITVPPDVTVSIDDRFAIDNRGTFEVTALRERTSHPLVLFEVVGL
jgi:Phage head-tail joining protein